MHAPLGTGALLAHQVRQAGFGNAKLLLAAGAANSLAGLEATGPVALVFLGFLLILLIGFGLQLRGIFD